jgi:hypothetical protein
MGVYTIEDFAGFSPAAIPASVLTILSNLENELKRHAVSEPHVPHHYVSHHHGNNTNNNNNHPHHTKRQAPAPIVRSKSSAPRKNAASVSASDWDALRSFKPTKKPEAADGPDKNINDIRMMLNKITQKTYETLKTGVINGIGECLNTYSDDATMSKLSKHFFDIVARDRFLTDIYVDLYLALIAFFPAFDDHFKQRVEVYRATIDTMKYADPEKDYDAYCDYVKVNDQRKAMTLFIIQLFKRDHVPASSMLDLMKFLLDKTTENRGLAGRTNEVDEITENFYLTYLHCGCLLDQEDEWRGSIIPAIREFASMQMGAYPSVSSRALLKYQDMEESIEAEEGDEEF